MVIIPQAIKTALLVDREFGLGVILVHEPDGCWSNPVFVTLNGYGAGGEAGIEATELVLILKSKKCLDRALRGKLTLGGNVSVAAGLFGREAEVGANRQLEGGSFFVLSQPRSVRRPVAGRGLSESR